MVDDRQQKKTNIMQETCTCTAAYVLKHSWTYVVRRNSLKSGVGTLIQYLL